MTTTAQPARAPRRINIAGLAIPLSGAGAALAELQSLYAEFDARGASFAAEERNPHLCRAGCSHCCRSGAVFAVTLVEAVQWALAVEALPAETLATARHAACNLLPHQVEAFSQVAGPADTPGQRDEALFSARITRLNAHQPACPLLVGDLCGVYAGRPMLCRAYGFPVDAYAVEGGGAMVFRSLCVLYEGRQLRDYVRARDLKERLGQISRQLGGGQDWGRFTSLEAILATLMA